LIVASEYWQCARSSGAESASCFASHLEIYGPILPGIEGRRVVASVDTGLLIDAGEVGANLFAGDDSAGYGAVVAEFNWQYVAGGDGGCALLERNGLFALVLIFAVAGRDRRTDPRKGFWNWQPDYKGPE